MGVDYADDIGEALAILVASTQATPEVLEAPPTRARLVELAEGWVILEASLWVDTRESSKEPHRKVKRVRSDAMNRTRMALIEAGFTLSNDTTSNLVVSMAA